MSEDAEWLAIAGRARNEIRYARRGDKMGIYRRHAAANGISGALLRRAITAHEFFEDLEKSGIAVPRELRLAPIGVIDIVARWAQRDRDAAFAAALTHLAGDLTFREFMAREAASRPGGIVQRPARWIDVKRAWTEAVLAQLSKQTCFRNMLLIDPIPDDPPVDAWVLSSGARLGAVVVVGPYRGHGEYEGTRENWIFRTVGVARVAGRIWLAVPTATHARSYAERLARWSIPTTDVVVVPLLRTPNPEIFMGPKS